MLLFLVSALAFVVLLTGLILVHECGHFFVARWSGVEVEEFGFGLPPRAKTLFYWQGTRFSFNWIPFGGFVRLKGENAMSQSERRAKGSFSAASIPARLLILIAGVAMNFLVAFLLFLVGFSVGRWIPTYVTFADMEAAAVRGDIHLQLGVVVEDVAPDSPAARAGLVSDSMILSVDGQAVAQSDDVVKAQEGKRRVTYTVLTPDQQEQTLSVTLADGKAGITLATVPRELSADRRSLLAAVPYALHETQTVTVQTMVGIGRLVRSLVTSGSVPEGITGIVGIARLTRDSVQQGFFVYLRLVAVLSLSLAALNILPFPALDGGRALFVLIEAVLRRPIGRTLELAMNSVGFTLLLILILFVTFYDVLRIFW